MRKCFKALTIAILAVAIPAAAANAQTARDADILGIKMGDSLESAEQKLNDSGVGYKIQIKKGRLEAGAFASEEIAFGLEGRVNDNSFIFVAAAVTPPHPVIGIWRRHHFIDGWRPGQGPAVQEQVLVEDIKEAMIAKAGPMITIDPQFERMYPEWNWGTSKFEFERNGYHPCLRRAEDKVLKMRNGSFSFSGLNDDGPYRLETKCGVTLRVKVDNRGDVQEMADIAEFWLVDYAAAADNLRTVYDILEKGQAEAAERVKNAAEKPKL